MGFERFIEGPWGSLIDASARLTRIAASRAWIDMVASEDFVDRTDAGEMRGGLGGDRAQFPSF